MTVEAVDAAAWGCVLGVDGFSLLHEEDQLEGRLRLAVIERAFEHQRRLSRQAAVEIANAVGQLLKG